MSNLIDYLRWRADMTLQQCPFNEVDNLVMSQLANLLWEVGLLPGEQPTLRELNVLMDGKDYVQGMTANDDRHLLPLVARSERFGDTRLYDYVHEFSEDEDKQFAAVTFLLADGSIFVSFRGTDGSLVGWKEDFNLCLPTPIPSQTQAREYLRATMETCLQRSVMVGGHSKGGNLAMYATATLPEDMQHRLKAVYSNDAPGLNDTVFLSDGYKHMELILHAFVPQSSIIGMLLMHPKSYTVIRSNSVSVFQHNPYTWQVEQGRFIREKELQNSSVFIEKVLKGWLAELDEDHRQQFVNMLFGILQATEAKSFGKDLWLGALRNPKAIVTAVQGIDANTRQKFIATLSVLANVAVQNGKSQLNMNHTEDEENGRQDNR